jgi:hypothetical protein
MRKTTKAKGTGDMVQVVALLSYHCKALSSNPSATKVKKETTQNTLVNARVKTNYKKNTQKEVFIASG